MGERRFKRWLRLRRERRAARQMRRLVVIPAGAQGGPTAPRLVVQPTETSRAVSPELAAEVRPHLEAAIEAGYGRLWMLREIGLRRDALRNAVSRIVERGRNEPTERYVGRLDRYANALLPRPVWAAAPRLSVTPRNPSSKQVTQGNRPTEGNRLTERHQRTRGN